MDTTDFSHFHFIFDDFSISLQECIKDIIKKEKYMTHRVKKKLIPQIGNFLGCLYEVDIEGETADSKNTTSLFIKTSVRLQNVTSAEMSNLYSRELFIYNDLSTVFHTLQDEANVPDREKFKVLKTYNSDNESVIMENLSKKGFKTYSNTQVMPLKFAELSVIELAKFHALSYVTKKKMPKYFDNEIKIMENSFNLNSDWEVFIHNVCAAVDQVLKDEVKTKFTNYAPRMIETFNKYIKNVIPLNGCLCHGDYKFLNIMVKEVDGEVSAVQPIDYQLVYYGSPVNDFLFFIFTGTDRDFRKKHLNYLKDLYFKNFTKFLSYFNVDVNSSYSREEFENDYKERLEMGLAFGITISAFTYAHTDEGFDMRKFSLSELLIIPDEMFAKRVTGIVEDYIDWGYL